MAPTLLAVLSQCLLEPQTPYEYCCPQLPPSAVRPLGELHYPLWTVPIWEAVIWAHGFQLGVEGMRSGCAEIAASRSSPHTSESHVLEPFNTPHMVITGWHWRPKQVSAVLSLTMEGSPGYTGTWSNYISAKGGVLRRGWWIFDEPQGQDNKSKGQNPLGANITVLEGNRNLLVRSHEHFLNGKHSFVFT